MKLLFIFLLGIVSTKLAAQTDNRIFYSQLMVVFSDMDKNFELLKADLKDVEGTDTLYESTTHLEGTKENTILISPGLSAYQAMITDSISFEGSQFIVKAWKQKLTGALADSFTQTEKEFHSSTDPTIDGYEYFSDRISVLLLRHKTGDNNYWMNLVIKPK